MIAKALEQFNGKWAVNGQFYCGGTDHVIDRVLVSNLSKKKAHELAEKYNTNEL